MFKERQVIKEILAHLYLDHDGKGFVANPDKEWDGETIENVAETLTNHGYTPANAIHMKPEDQIALVWDAEDILGMVNDNEEDDREITMDEAREILEIVDRRHDCTIGVSWEVLDCHVDMFISDREKKAAKHPATVAEINPTFPEGYQLDGQP